MTRNNLLLPLSLAGILALAALTPSAISTLQGPSEQVAGIKAAPGAPGESNKCPYPPNRPSMVMTANPSQLSRPNTVNMSGKLKSNCGVGGRKLGLYKNSGSTSWTLVSTATTASDGSYAFKPKVDKTTDWKTVFAGDKTFPAAQSNPVTVKVGK